jgi:hypothetical protein
VLHCKIVGSFPLRYAAHHCIVIVLKRLSDFLPLPIRNSNNKTKEATMTKIAAIPISSFGMTCEKCGDTLITPEWSEYVSEHEVVNIWSCTTCGFQFETATNMPADSESEIDSNVLRYFFPLLLVA